MSVRSSIPRKPFKNGKTYGRRGGQRRNSATLWKRCFNTGHMYRNCRARIYCNHCNTQDNHHSFVYPNTLATRTSSRGGVRGRGSTSRQYERTASTGRGNHSNRGGGGVPQSERFTRSGNSNPSYSGNVSFASTSAAGENQRG